MVAQAKVIVADNRVRRIAKFIDQMTLALSQRAIECDLPTGPLEPFMTEIFGKMCRSKDEEFPLMQLLEMLLCDVLREEMFERYRRKLVRYR